MYFPKSYCPLVFTSPGPPVFKMGTSTLTDRAAVQSRMKRTLTMLGKRTSSVSVAKKRAKHLFAAQSKENATVPSGANFAPTPKDAWGASLIKQEKAPLLSPRQQPPPRAGEWGDVVSPEAAAQRDQCPGSQPPTHLPRGCPRRIREERPRRLEAGAGLRRHECACPRSSTPPPPLAVQVRQFEWDHEHTLLDGWNLVFNGSWPLQLSGKVFNNAGPGLEDGDLVEYTSQIVSFNGRVAVTKSGTKYYLGTPSPRFEAIRIQLCRASAAAEQGPAAASALASSSFPFDVERPFRFIDLGPTVTCMHMHMHVHVACTRMAPR